MALNITRALCGRQFNHLRSGSSPMYLTARTVGMKIISTPVDDRLSYEEKNIQLKREMSPHLTIYKVQLTSMLSITHRITGMMLAGYASALGIGALVLPNDLSYYVTLVEGLHLSAPTLAFIKFYIALPATYHTCNGVRHLLWDMGKFLKLGEVYTTGYIMVGVSVALALILAAI